MEIHYEWNEAKSLSNRERERVGFEAMESFEWETAVVTRSDRQG